MAVERWISVTEAAKTLGKSERTIRRQCESGKLRARQESTPSGKAWTVCLEPLETTAEEVTEGEIEELSSTRTDDAAATNAAAANATAIVPALEMSVSSPAANAADNATANSEVLVQVSELRHDMEKIKGYLAGQIANEMRDTLAALPTRDDLRDDLTTAMTAAITPVMQRMETLATENAQLQMQLQAEKQKTLDQTRRPWWKKLFPER